MQAIFINGVVNIIDFQLDIIVCMLDIYVCFCGGISFPFVRCCFGKGMKVLVEDIVV
jgi:Trk-type K+ transport system membrane component